jgi:hypothetical protein
MYIIEVWIEQNWSHGFDRNWPFGCLLIRAEECTNHERGGLCYVRDSVRIAVCTLGFDQRARQLAFPEFSVLLCALLFKTISLRTARLDLISRFQDLEHEVAESAEEFTNHREGEAPAEPRSKRNTESQEAQQELRPPSEQSS